MESPHSWTRSSLDTSVTDTVPEAPVAGSGADTDDDDDEDDGDAGGAVGGSRVTAARAGAGPETAAELSGGLRPEALRPTAPRALRADSGPVTSASVDEGGSATAVG